MPKDLIWAIDRIRAANRSNEKFEDPTGDPLRRGLAGIGWISPALEGRNLTSVENWTGQGHPSHHIQLSSLNAGNLHRSTKIDTLSDLVASQFHITCLQEAKSLSVCSHLLNARGIVSCESRDRCTRFNAGGSGIKVVQKCYSEDAPHCDFVNRPYYYDGPVEDGENNVCGTW